MKRALSIVICGALALSGVIFGVGAYNGEVAHDEDMLDLVKDASDLYASWETPEESRARLIEEVGEELAEEILSTPDGCTYYDLVNGTVEVVTIDPSYPEVTSTEPYIPEGREVAEMPIVEMGARDMSQIHVPSVDQFPYCTNAYLEVTYADGSHYVGSGVFVRDRILLTAGHMLKNPERGKAVHIDVTPGGIYSSFETVPVNGMMIPNKWHDDT